VIACLGRAAAVAGLLLAVSQPAAAIVNGAPTTEARYAERFGWAVALEAPKTDAVCTAQLISPTWVLTAGHCTGAGNRLVIGSPSRARGRVLAAADAVRHPDYDAETGAFDVGLIRLKEPVDIPPVPLITAAEAPLLLQAKAHAVIGGWGKRSTSLGFSDLFIVSDVQLADLRRLPDRFVFFDPVSGPCGGDSGGPLLLERSDGTRVLAGIASRVVGNLCAQGGGISIYVDVAAMRSFIEQHVADLPR